MIRYITYILLALLSLSSCIKHDGTEDQGKIFFLDVKQLSSDQTAFLSSAQGILAKQGVKLYLSNGADDFWLQHMAGEGMPLQEIASIPELVEQYSEYFDRYVTCNIDSVAVAATVAGPYNALVVTDKIIASGLVNSMHEIFDLRGKDERWLLDYVKANIDKYSLNAITQHNPKRPAALIDYAIANNYICMVCKDNPELIKEFYSLIKPNSPKFGFGTPYGKEYQDVELGAKYGLYTVPSSNTMNLSFFSQFEATEKQPAPESSVETLPTKNTHYVMIMISDGDNLNWTIGGCISSPKYMGSQICGNYPINWMYPPEAMNAAGLVHNYYQKNRPRYNYYLGALSGQGYTYPSKHLNRKDFAIKSNSLYSRAGLDYCVIMDNLDFRTTQRDVLADMVKNMPGQKGIYYMDYGNYAKWGGDSYLIGEVPVHSLRYRLWLPKDPLEQIAEKINRSSRNVNDIDAYSSVVVHAWSYGMDDVERFISLLDDHVVLVNAAQFMDLIKSNVLKREKTASL